MAGLFSGQAGLRSQYRQAMAGTPSHALFQRCSVNISGATTPETAILLATVEQSTRMALFSNGTSADIAVLLQHPEATDATDVSKRLLFTELAANTPLNIDTSFGMNLSFDPGTRIWLYITRGSVLTDEKIRFQAWG